jgi:hypothetical protein
MQSKILTRAQCTNHDNCKKRLRYLSNKVMARSIITGTYKIPTDMDPSTKLILEEIGRLEAKLVNREGMEVIIMLEHFQHFWRKVGEFTSLLMSGVHYSNYKAVIKCDISIKLLAQQLTVVARSGIPPKGA